MKASFNFATQSEEALQTVQEHKAPISDLQTSKDHTMVITASKDTSAKVKPHSGDKVFGRFYSILLSCFIAI